LVRPINYSSADNIGIESVFRMQLPKRKGNIMLTLNGFRNVINGDNVEAGLQSSALNWSTRLTANYKITPLTNFQLTGFYMSPFIQPAGRFYMIGGLDAGIRQELFRGKAQVTVNVSDIFNTKRFEMFNALTGYEMTGQRKRESRVLMATFTWRFGQGEENTQRRNRQQQQQGMDDGGGMF
jgi:iron complex outermembrane recepter protein